MAMLRGPLSDGVGGRGIVKTGNRWLVWRGYRWVPITDRDVFETVLGAMADVYTEDDQGRQTPLSMSPQKAKDIVDILSALVKLPVVGLPYVDPGLEADRDWTLAVGDELVTVGTDEITVQPRTSGWVSTSGCSFSYDPEAECPLWEKTVEQWGDGEEDWGTLLGRCMGSALVPYRDWQRFVFLSGKVRGGKGVIMRLMKDMVGSSAMMSRSLDDVVEPSGMWGSDIASILFVDEVQDMDNRLGEKAAGILKRVIGQSPIRIQEKYVPAAEVTSPAMVWMAANQLPNLPDKGSGLSSKMLVLPFVNSFLGREDFTLEDRLRDELPGILNWCLRHLMDLREAREAKRYEDMWPQTFHGNRMKKQYQLTVNVWDAFLDHYCTKTEGYVTKDRVRTLFKKWASDNKVDCPGHNYIVAKMLSETSWDLKPGQLGSSGTRVIRGISLKREASSSLE